MRVVSTQGIDGAWGNLKTFLRARGGTTDGQLEASVKEFQWRTNLPLDYDSFFFSTYAVYQGVWTTVTG